MIRARRDAPVAEGLLEAPAGEPQLVNSTRRDSRGWAVIAGGGTAGHALAGVSVAEEMIARGVPRAAVHFVGSARGPETRLIPEAGFALTALGGRGLQRRVTIANLAALAGLSGALLRSLRLLLSLRPAVVISLGGYAAAACSAAAVLLRVPLVVVEQNAVAGLANRMLARFAVACATAFDSVKLPRAAWTGNPVRAEVLAVRRGTSRKTARGALGIADGRRLVVVFGGSLGARTLNEAVTAALDVWADRSDLHVRHVAGPRGFAEARRAAGAPRHGELAYDLIEYEHDMATVYAAADLAVCRAGATTVAELAAVGLPALLVPLPGAPRDHQSANAARLVEAGAAQVLADRSLDGARLAAEVDALLSDPARLAEMSRSAASLARPDAAAAVADLTERCARRPPPRGIREPR